MGAYDLALPLPAIGDVDSAAQCRLAQEAERAGDELTDGRAVLGLGLSGPRVIEPWHGVKFQSTLRRQREAIDCTASSNSSDG